MLILGDVGLQIRLSGTPSLGWICNLLGWICNLTVMSISIFNAIFFVCPIVGKQ